MGSDLRQFLDHLQAHYPEDLAQVSRVVRPDHYEVTAILERLDRDKKYPLVHFTSPLNQQGDPSAFGLMSNVFGTRERCATALGFPREQSKMPLSLEFARLETQPVKAVAVSTKDAPVMANVLTGEAVDLGVLPIVRHYEMDIGPVLTMAVIMKDPDEGFYDVSFVKAFPQGPRRVGVAIHSPHLQRILATYEARGQRAPFVCVLGHHPSFFLGSLGLAPYGTNDYDAIGGFMREPVRLTPSATWGEAFIVPADAEIIVEGEMLPGERTIVNPFGEVTRHYQAQCLRPLGEVTALTYRDGAILQDVFSGHQEHWNLGGIPKEGSIYNTVNRRFGCVKAVHMPYSGCSRFVSYISIDKKRGGVAKMIGMEVLAQTKLMSSVVVVDEKIDPFNEAEVVWAVLTQTNPSRDVSVIHNAESFFLTAAGTSKVIIDATRPTDIAFPEQFKVPDAVLEGIKLEEWID